MAKSESLRWTEAAGAAHLKPGFCFDPQQDLHFAVGWPHMRFLDPTPMEDERSVEEAVRVLNVYDRPPQLLWSQRLAQGLVRALGTPAVFELTPDARNLRPEAIEALWEPRPLRPGEASRLLETRLGTNLVGVTDRTLETFVLLLEALTSTLEVAESITEHLEQLSEPVLSSHWTLPPTVTYQLGYLLLRLKPAQATSLRYRLEAVLARAPKSAKGTRASWQDGFSHFRALQFVLRGAEAARKSADRNLNWYTHITDDSNFVRMRVSMDTLGYLPDARLVFLGDHDVLRSYVKRWEIMKSDEQRWFWEQIAGIRSPHVAVIALGMSHQSTVRKETAQWLVAHPDLSVEHLKKVAGGDGVLAAHAAKILKTLAV